MTLPDRNSTLVVITRLERIRIIGISFLFVNGAHQILMSHGLYYSRRRYGLGPNPVDIRWDHSQLPGARGSASNLVEVEVMCINPHIINDPFRRE